MARPPTACLTCRARRRKCDIRVAGQPCSYCRHRSLQCLPSNSQAQKQSPNSVESGQPRDTVTHGLGNETSSVQLPDMTVRVELVQLYFDYVHDQLHSLFHKPTILGAVEKEDVSEVLLLAMIALSARFSHNPFFAGTEPRNRGEIYAIESQRLLNLRDISLETAQACVLLGAYSIVQGEAGAESVHYCAACRIAQLLDLPNRPSADGLDREVDIRVWHTLRMIDEWSSAGVQLPRQMPNASVNDVPLPLDETLFLQLRKHNGYVLEKASDVPSSLLAQMIKLNRILAAVNTLNSHTAKAPSQDPEATLQEIQDLTHQLDTWYTDLPANLRDTPENLKHHANLGQGRIFVAVLLGYYHYGQLLYYRFLHDADSTDNIAQRYALRCKRHAESLCAMVYASHSTPGCDVLYNMVGHILVIASSIQIHTLLFSSSETEISAARTRLERNFGILLMLRRIWPTLDMCMLRLRMFHNACVKGMEGSFRLDEWMLGFLSEFAKPVGERFGDDEPPGGGAWTVDSFIASADGHGVEG